MEADWNKLSIFGENIRMVIDMSEFLHSNGENAPCHSESEIKIEKDSTITINGRKISDFWDGTIHSDTKPLRMKIRNICGDESIFSLNI